MTRRHYVDTSRGQLHLRMAGDGDPLIMSHWAPLSSRMYESVLPHIARAGFRVLAFDLMGFGQSDRRAGPWQISEHADVLEEAILSLGASSCWLLGGHFSNNVTVELAHRPKIDPQGVILDGGPFIPAEQFKAMIAKAKIGRGRGLHEDGSHRTYVWDVAVNALKFFDPDFELSERTLPMVYEYMADYLATGMPDDMGATVPYDLRARLETLALPVLVLAAETDPLRPSFEPMVELIQRGRGHCFPGGHPLIDPDGGAAYAAVIVDFLKEFAG